MLAPYPIAVDSWKNELVEMQMQVNIDVVKALRSMKANYNVSKMKPEAFYSSKSDESSAAMSVDKAGLMVLAGLSDIKQLADGESAPAGCAVSIVSETLTVYILLKGVVDAATEIEKLDKKLEQIEKQYETLKSKIEDAGYEAKVPEKVRILDAEKLGKQAEEIDSIKKARTDFASLL